MFVEIMLEINTCPVFVRAAILLNRALTGTTVTHYKGCPITNVVTKGYCCIQFNTACTHSYIRTVVQRPSKLLEWLCISC